jgi:8-oxo-dGTP pyrophosphatase MutT (NUDIX family)
MKNEYSIAAVVIHEKKFLLLKYELGHWGFVKGNKEKGETPEDTIMRELKEETGIKDAQIIENFEHKYDYYYKLKGNTIHKFVKCLLIKSKSKEIQLSYEHVDYEWLSFEEALKRLSHKNTKEILKKAKKFLSSRLDRFLD